MNDREELERRLAAAPTPTIRTEYEEQLRRLDSGAPHTVTSSGNGVRFLVGMLVLLLVAGAGAAGWHFLKGRSDTTANDTVRLDRMHKFAMATLFPMPVGDPHASLETAIAALRNNKPADATAALNAALAIPSFGEPTAYAVVATMLNRLGRYPEAREIVTAGIAAADAGSGESKRDLYQQLGEAQAALGQCVDAEISHQSAITYWPTEEAAVAESEKLRHYRESDYGCDLLYDGNVLSGPSVADTGIARAARVRYGILARVTMQKVDSLVVIARLGNAQQTLETARVLFDTPADATCADCPGFNIIAYSVVPALNLLGRHEDAEALARAALQTGIAEDLKEIAHNVLSATLAALGRCDEAWSELRGAQSYFRIEPTALGCAPRILMDSMTSQ